MFDAKREQLNCR